MDTEKSLYKDFNDFDMYQHAFRGAVKDLFDLGNRKHDEEEMNDILGMIANSFNVICKASYYVGGNGKRIDGESFAVGYAVNDDGPNIYMIVLDYGDKIGAIAFDDGCEVLTSFDREGESISSDDLTPLELSIIIAIGHLVVAKPEELPEMFTAEATKILYCVFN